MIDLIHGNCIQEMRELSDKSIDMVVTSPPYDSLREYGNITPWNFETFKNCAYQLKRVLKPGGVVAWVVADQVIKGSESGSSFRQALFFKDIGFNLHDTMIWNKKSCPYPDRTRYSNSFEYIFILSMGRPKVFNPIADRKNKWAGTLVHGTDRAVDGNTIAKHNIKEAKGRIVKDFGIRFNVWELPNPGVAGNKHPATFPVKLAQDLISSWSNKSAVVLDPFMGSGTTGIACQNLSRNFIGIEINKEYFDIVQSKIHPDVFA